MERKGRAPGAIGSDNLAPLASPRQAGSAMVQIRISLTGCWESAVPGSSPGQAGALDLPHPRGARTADHPWSAFGRAFSAPRRIAALNKSIRNLSGHAESRTRPDPASPIKPVQPARAGWAGGTSLRRLETLDRLVDHLGQLALAHRADLGGLDLAALEHHQGRNAADAVGARGLLVLVDVDLGDLQPAGVIAGDVVQHRRDRLARAAPLRPEIQQHRCLGLQHLGFEVLVFDVGDVVAHGEPVEEGKPDRWGRSRALQGRAGRASCYTHSNHLHLDHRAGVRLVTPAARHRGISSQPVARFKGVRSSPIANQAVTDRRAPAGGFRPYFKKISAWLTTFSPTSSSNSSTCIPSWPPALPIAVSSAARRSRR